MEDFPPILGGISAKQFLTEYWQKKTSLDKRCYPKLFVAHNWG